MSPETLPCGCVRVINKGHTHTKLCAQHLAEALTREWSPPPTGNEDLL